LKKLTLLIMLLYGQLFALDTQSTLKIYHQIFSAILHKEKIKVYTQDRELQEIFKYSERILPVSQPELSDIVIVGNSHNYEKIIHQLTEQKKKEDVIIFATDYHLLKESPLIIGALYWKKGRSQLLFIKPRLEQYYIELPKAYEHFIVESL